MKAARWLRVIDQRRGGWLVHSERVARADVTDSSVPKVVNRVTVPARRHRDCPAAAPRPTRRAGRRDLAPWSTAVTRQGPSRRGLLPGRRADLESLRQRVPKEVWDERR